MNLDFDQIIFAIGMFLLTMIFFFIFIRLSNNIISRKLNALLEKQEASERLAKKLARDLVESRKALEERIIKLEKNLEGVELEEAIEKDALANKAVMVARRR